MSERPYRRLSPLTPLVRSFVLVVAVLASSWDDLLRRDIGPLAWLLLAMLAAGAVYGTASWLRTKYWIEADELRVDTGVVSRQSRRIRVDRLQGIDIAQPLVARAFGLAEVRMDVAGGGAREGSLAFLPLREAQELRETLLARRDAVRAARAAAPEPSGPPDATGAPAATGPAGPGVTPEQAEQEAPPAPEQVLARLDLAVLVASIVLSPETLLAALAAAAFGVTFLVRGELGGAAALLPVAIGFAVAQLRKLAAYYGFTVVQTAVGVQVRRGLLDLSTQTIAVARVQGVVVTEPLMWRPWGWARLDVALAGTAGHEGDGRPAASTVMPVAPRPVVLWLARRMLEATGGADPDAVPLVPAPRQARWAAPVRWRRLAVGVGADLVVSRRGVLGRRTDAVPHARVQSLRLRQGPWQRRLGLADLEVDSPPGPVSVRARHRRAAEARRLLELADEAARRHRTHASPDLASPGV